MGIFSTVYTLFKGGKEIASRTKATADFVAGRVMPKEAYKNKVAEMQPGVKIAKAAATVAAIPPVVKKVASYVKEKTAPFVSPLLKKETAPMAAKTLFAPTKVGGGVFNYMAKYALKPTAKLESNLARELVLKPGAQFLAAAASKPKTTSALLQAPTNLPTGIFKALSETMKEKPLDISVTPKSTVGKALFGEEKISGLGGSEIVDKAGELFSKIGLSKEASKRLMELGALPFLALFADPTFAPGKKATKELLETAVRELGKKELKTIMGKEGITGIERVLAERGYKFGGVAGKVAGEAPTPDAALYKIGEEQQWGTRNQYLAKNPYGVYGTNEGAKASRWELEQVLKDKPAYLNDSRLLSSDELKQFADENGLVYKKIKNTEVVAKTNEAADKVLNAKSAKDLGLALGYEDLAKAQGVTTAAEKGVANVARPATELAPKTVAKTAEEVIPTSGKVVEKVAANIPPTGTKTVAELAADREKYRLGTVAKRIAASDLPEEVKAAVAESPQSYYQILTAAEKEKVVANMTETELRTIFNEEQDAIAVAAGVKLAENLKAEGRMAEATKILEDMVQMGAKTGQTTQAFRQLAEYLTPAIKISDLEKRLDDIGRVLTDSQKAKLMENFDTTKKFRDEMNAAKRKAESTLEKADLERYAKAAEVFENQVLKESKLVAQMTPRSISDTAIAAMQGNLLTVKSLIKNPLYNIFFMPYRVAQHYLTNAATDIWSLLRAKKPTSVYGNPVKIFQGMAEGFTRSIKNLLRGTPPEMLAAEEKQSIAQGYRGFQPLKSLRQAITGLNLPVDKVTGKIRWTDRAKKLFEGLVGFAPEGTFRALNIGDEPFRNAWGKFLLDIESRKAGKILLDSPIVREEAKKAVFQEINAITRYINGMIRTTEKIPGVGGLAKFLVRTNVPYINTPINVMAATIKLILPEVNAAQFLIALGQKNEKKAIESGALYFISKLNRMAASTLVEAGLVNDRSYEGAKQQQLEYNQIPPGHINVSGLKRLLSGEDPHWKNGDTTKNFAILGVFGAALAMEAKAKEEGRGKLTLKEKFSAEGAANVLKDIFGVGQWAIEQTFLAGVNSLLSTIADSSSNSWSYKINQQIKNNFSAIASVVLPNNLSAAVRVQDNFIRDTQGETMKDTLENVVKSKLFMTENMPIKRGLFGEKLERVKDTGTAGRIVYQFLDPFDTQKISSDPTYKAVSDLYEVTQDTDAIPAVPKDSFTYNKVKYDLTKPQYEKYVELIGTERKKFVNSLISAPAYRKASPDIQLKLMIDAYQNGYDSGKARFLRTEKGMKNVPTTAPKTTTSTAAPTGFVSKIQW